LAFARACSSESSAIIAELTQAIAGAYGWQGVAPQVIEAVTLTPDQMQEVAGSYGHIANYPISP
jgi:hypothetical protein